MRRLGPLAAALLLLVAACDDDPLVQPPDNGTAEIRVIHGSPDAPMVDIYVEGSATPVFEDLAYGDASAYATVDAGTYNVQIRAAGADPASAPVFETGNITLQTGDDLTALAAGLLASNDPADQSRVLALYEDFVTPAAGNAVVRVAAISPGVLRCVQRFIGSTQQGLNPTGQLAGTKRFGHIIVRPQLQAQDFLVFLNSGGENDDRRLRFTAVDAHKFVAAHLRHHQIEQDEVRFFIAGQEERLAAVRGGEHAKAFLAQIALDQGA